MCGEDTWGNQVELASIGSLTELDFLFNLMQTYAKKKPEPMILKNSYSFFVN